MARFEYRESGKQRFNRCGWELSTEADTERLGQRVNSGGCR